MKSNEKVVGLVAWLTLCLIACAAGGFATANGLEWYEGLNKPSWNPPSWLFAPVWITLYILMAIAAWLVSNEHKPGKKAAIGLFVVQLILNILWSVVFFVGKNPGAAAVEIVILWMATLATLALFFQQSKTAGLMIIPYFLWVTFAAVLNITIWRMNS